MRLQYIIIFSVAAVISLSSGCSTRIPEPITYPYSQQYKMQASHHWQVLAADLANRINNQLIMSDNIDKMVFVQETCGDESTPCEPLITSPFNEAFRDLLISHLVAYGVPTASSKTEDDLEIQYKVQVVRHRANRVRTIQPGLLTALSAAIVVLRNAPSDLAIVTAGASADVANSNLTGNGHYEVIITTSMKKNNRYLFRDSDIYYINDEDFWQYSNITPKPSKLSLQSQQKTENKTVPLPLTSPPPPMEDEAKDEVQQPTVIEVPENPKTNL